MRTLRTFTPVLAPLLMTLATPPASAQSSFSTTDSGSSLLLQEGGYLQFSFDKPTVSIAYQTDGHKRASDSFHLEPDKRIHNIPRFGFEIRGKADNGTAHLFGDNHLSTGVRATLNLGWSDILSYIPSKVETIESVPRIAAAQAEIESREKDRKTADQLRHDRVDEVERVVLDLRMRQRDLKRAIAEGKPATEIDALRGEIRRMEERLNDARKGVSEAQTAYNGAEKALRKAKRNGQNARLRFGPGTLSYDSLNVQVGYNRDQVTLLDEAVPVKDQIRKRTTGGPFAALTYNAEIGGRNGASWLGLSLGVEEANNADDLKEVDVEDRVTFQDGNTSRDVVTRRKALRGDFKEFTSATLRADYAYYPESLGARIAFDLFVRHRAAGGSSATEPGVGAFWVRKGDPLRPIAGLIVKRDSAKKVKVDLVAGFDF